MIIYNGSESKLIQWLRVILSGDKLTIASIYKSLLPVCDKPYHKFKENLPHLEDLEYLWNYSLFSKHYKTILHVIFVVVVFVPLKS